MKKAPWCAFSPRLLGVSALLGLALPLHAQTTGSIRGTVETGRDTAARSDGRSEEPEPAGRRSVVTDARRAASSSRSLPPGAYTVTATLDGFAPKAQTLQLSLGQAAVMRIELLPAQAVADHRDRAGGAPSRPSRTRSAEPWTRQSFQALPTGRNYASVAQLASGINTDSSDVRQTSITVYGSTGLENAYMVDGANTTGVEIGNQGKVMNFEFIQEVEIKAGGYEAEYTGAQGGILNVVTKSGRQRVPRRRLRLLGRRRPPGGEQAPRRDHGRGHPVRLHAGRTTAPTSAATS